MARGFNLTAEINLRGPSNLRQVVSNLRRQLGSINTNVNVQINQQTSRQITVVNRSFQDFNRTLQQTRNIADATARSINQLGNAARTLSTNLQNIPQTINQVAQGANQAAQANNRAAAATRGATSEFAEFGRQSALAVRRFAAFATVTGVIYKASNAITNATKDFIDFNQQLIKVAQVTDTPVKSLDFLVSNITQLSTGLGVASQDLISVSQTVAQAGLSARDTSIALQALAKSVLAPSFDNLNNTAEGSIALMRQFGISAGQLEGALGSINAVAAKFAVEAGDIVTAISRTGGVFAAASKGVSEGTNALNEFIAVFTSVRATTRESAETIATGLRTIFTRIQRAETIDALKAYGVALTDLEGKFVGPYEATRRLAEGLSTLDPRDIRFSRIVEELGGFRQIGKVIPLIQQFATAQDALRVAQQGQGSLTRDAATAQLSLANQIAKVREEFTALVRSIGQSQGFQDLVRLGLDLASAFIKVADAVKGALPALTAIFAIKGFQALTQFSRGFAGALRTGGGQGLSAGGYVHRFAGGGVVPGSGRGDKIPALLEPGEVVMSNRAGNKYGRGNLVRMNKYATGGGPRSSLVQDVSYRSTHDGDSLVVDYTPKPEPYRTSTRLVGYDAYELDRGTAAERQKGLQAKNITEAWASKQGKNLLGKFEAASGKKDKYGRPMFDAPVLGKKLVNAGVAIPYTGSGDRATSKYLGGIIQKYADGSAGGVKAKPEPFGTGTTKFPRRISNAYAKQMEKEETALRFDKLIQKSPTNERIMVDEAMEQQIEQGMQQPLDREQFASSFRRAILRDEIASNISNFAKLVGLPQEDLSVVLPRQLDFGSGSGPIGSRGGRDVLGGAFTTISPYGSRGAEGWDLGEFGYTKQDEQDLFGFEKLLEEKKKELAKIRKTPTRTFDDGSFSYDLPAADKAQDEVNALQKQIFSIGDKRRTAIDNANKTREQEVASSGRATLGFGTRFGNAQNPVLYHELTHQLFKGLRVKSADSFDKYKQRVTTLFETDNDGLADAFDALNAGYSSADVVYGRAYKLDLLGTRQREEIRKDPAGEDTKNLSSLIKSGTDAKKATQFRPINPSFNEAMLKFYSQEHLDKVEDNGKEEFLTTLVEKMPVLDQRLQSILDSTMTELLGGAGIQRQQYVDGGWVERMKQQPKSVLESALQKIQSAAMFADDTGAYVPSFNTSGSQSEAVSAKELKERFQAISMFLTGKDPLAGRAGSGRKRQSKNALQDAGGYNQQELLDAVLYYQGGSGPLARAMVNQDYIFVDRDEAYDTEDVVNRLKASSQYKAPKKLYSGIGPGQFGEILKDAKIIGSDLANYPEQTLTKLQGQTIDFPTFLSTSTLPKVAKTFIGNPGGLMSIDASKSEQKVLDILKAKKTSTKDVTEKGSRRLSGIDKLNEVKLSGYDLEKEFVLPPSTKFRINSAKFMKQTMRKGFAKEGVDDEGLTQEEYYAQMMLDQPSGFVEFDLASGQDVVTNSLTDGVKLDLKAQMLRSGGMVQKFLEGGVAQRKLGYIDHDVIANPANEAVVAKGMEATGVSGPRLYTDKLIEMAVKARKEQSLNKLQAIYGVAGAGKTTLARGQGTDKGTLRETTRFPILSPEDIQRANEIILLSSSVSKDRLDALFADVDRAYTLSSTTPEEKERIKSQRASRDATGVGLEGRTPGSTAGVARDTAAGEALLNDRLGKRSVVLGRTDSGRLRRKRGDELVEIAKKRIGMTWGGFAPMTAGHESILDAAAAMGISPQDFVFLVGANESIKLGDPSSYRTAIFNQDARVLLAKAGAGARGATVVPKAADFEVPLGMDISEQKGRRKVLLPGEGSTVFVVDKTEQQTAKYKEAGYNVSNIERTGGISGTMVRDLIMSGNMAELQKVLSPGVYDLISNNIGRIQNRANVLPDIIEQVKQSQGVKLAEVERAIKAVGISRIDQKKMEDPEYAAKVQVLEELRLQRDKIKRSAAFEPYRLLDKLATSQPEQYALDFSQSQIATPAPVRTVKDRSMAAVAAETSSLASASSGDVGIGTGQSLLDNLATRLKTLGGESGLRELGVGIPLDLQKKIRTDSIKRGILDTARVTGLIEKAEAIKKKKQDEIDVTRHVAMAGLQPLDYSWDPEWELDDGRKYIATIRGFKSSYLQDIERFRARQKEAALEFGKDTTATEALGLLGQKTVQGPPRSLAIDFDDTLAFGTKMLDSSGKEDISAYYDEARVREVLSKATPTRLAQRLLEIEKDQPGTVRAYTRVLTARAESLKHLVTETLNRFGLPYTDSDITGVGQKGDNDRAIARKKADNLSTIERFIDDNEKNISAAQQKGIQSYRYSEPKAFENASDYEPFGAGNIEGALLEQTLAMKIGRPIDFEALEQNRALDFPNGLGAAASLFGLPSNIETEVKRTLNKDSFTKARSEFNRYFKENPDKYNVGGIVAGFAKRGKADYYSLEKSSGLSSGEFDTMVRYAKTNDFSLDEFRSYLSKRAADTKSRVGSVIDPKSLQSFLMHGAVGPRLGTGDLTEEQKKLAEMLKGPPDPQYNPNRFAEGGQAKNNIVRSSASDLVASFGEGSSSSGEVVASSIGGGLYAVSSSQTSGGGGRSLYDAVMEMATSKGSKLVSDRSRVSDSALTKIWTNYFSKGVGQDGKPVSKSPLPADKMYTGSFFKDTDYPEPNPSTWTGPAVPLQYAYTKFADGGTVPALVSNGEAYVPPKMAKKIGYGTLNRMNQADRNGMGRFAKGGISVFKGPGSGTSDSIPTNLPVGSFIIRAKATKALGLNKGGAVGYAQKLFVGGPPNPGDFEAEVQTILMELEQFKKAIYDGARQAGRTASQAKQAADAAALRKGSEILSRTATPTMGPLPKGQSFEKLEAARLQSRSAAMQALSRQSSQILSNQPKDQTLLNKTAQFFQNIFNWSKQSSQAQKTGAQAQQQASKAQQAGAQAQINAAQQQQQQAADPDTTGTGQRASRFNLSNLGTALAFTGPMLAQQIGQGIGGTTGAGVGGAATAFSSTLAVGAQFGVIGTFVGALAGGVAAIDGYNSAVAQKESELAGIDIDKTLEQSVQTRDRFAKTGKAEDASQLVSNFQKIQELEQQRSEANIRAERPGYLSSALSTVSFGYLGGDRRSAQEISGARTAEQQVGAQEAQAFISSMITAGKSYDQVTAILQQKGAAMSDLITAIAEADPAYQADVVAIQKSEMAEELKTRSIAEVRQKYVDQARSLTAAQFADAARAKASQKLAQQINIVSASITKTFDNLNQAINASSNNLKQASEELQRKISGGTGFTASLDALNVLQNPRAFGRAEQNVAIGQASQFAGRDRGFVEQLARFSLDAEDIVASGAARAQQAGVNQGVVAQNITAQLTQRLDAIFGQNTIGDELRKQLTENITEALKRGDEIDIQKLLEESGLSGQLQASKQAFDALQNSLKFVQEAMSFAANAANEYGKLQQNLRENQANYQNTIVQSNIAIKEALGQRVGIDERIQARRNVAATRAGVAPAQFNATELAGRRDVLQKEVEAVRSALNKTANSFDSTIPNTSAKFLALTKRLAETENALKATEQSLESLPSIIEGNINDIIGEIGRIQQEMSSRQQAAGSFAEQLVGSTPQEMVELNSTFNLLNNTLNGQITTINQSQAAQQAYFQALQNGSTQQEAYAAAQQAFAGQTKSALGLFSQLTQLSGLEGAEINTIRADLLEGFARAQGMGLQNNPMFQKMIELLRKPPEQSAEIQALQGVLRAQQAELATTTQKINEGVLAKQKDILDSANQQFIKALQDVRVKFDVEQLRNVGLGLGTPGQATNAPRPNRGEVVYASDGTYVNYQPRGTDTVPAMLTPGEFVVNARAAKNNLGLLRSINSTGSGKTYSRGGVVYAAGGSDSWLEYLPLDLLDNLWASIPTGFGVGLGTVKAAPAIMELLKNIRSGAEGIGGGIRNIFTADFLKGIKNIDYKTLFSSMKTGGFKVLENFADMVGYGAQAIKMDFESMGSLGSTFDKMFSLPPADPTDATALTNIDDLKVGLGGTFRTLGRLFGPTLGAAFGAMEDPNKTGRSRTVNAAFGALGAGSTTMGDVGATSITGSQMGGNLLQAGLTTAQYMAYGAPPPIAALLASGTLTTQEVAGYMGDVDNTQASEVRLKQQSTAQRNRGRTLDTTNMSSADRRAIQIVEQQGGIERLEGFNATEIGWIREKAKLDNSISLIDENGDGRADIAKNQTRLDELKRRREEHNATQKTIFSESKFGWFGENQTETKTQAEIDKAVKQEAAYQTRAKRASAQVAREDEARADAREQAKLDNEARIEKAKQLELDDNADRRAKQDRQDRATAVGLKPNASIKDIEREETRRKAITNQQLGLSVTASAQEIALRQDQQKQYQQKYGGLNDAADIAINSGDTLPPNAYSKEWKSAVDRRKELYAEINSMRTQIRDPNDTFFASQEEFEQYRKERLDSLYGDLDATNTIINQEHKAKGYHELSFADKRERWDQYRSGQEKEAKVQKREEIKARNRAAKQQADQMRALAKYANVPVPDKFSNPGAFFNWRKNLQKTIQKDIPFGSRTPEAMNALGIPSDVVDALYQPFSNEQLTSIYSAMLDSGRLSPSASRIVGALRLQKYNLAKNVESDPRLQQIISSASPSEQKAITREFETTFGKSVRQIGVFNQLINRFSNLNPGQQNMARSNLLERATKQGLIDPRASTDFNMSRLNALGGGNVASFLYPNQQTQNQAIRVSDRPQRRSRGGVIYASTGMLVPYEPRGTDTVPAMLTPGEFVINRQATQKHRPLLESINRSRGGSVKYLQEGGMSTDVGRYVDGVTASTPPDTRIDDILMNTKENNQLGNINRDNIQNNTRAVPQNNIATQEKLDLILDTLKGCCTAQMLQHKMTRQAVLALQLFDPPDLVRFFQGRLTSVNFAGNAGADPLQRGPFAGMQPNDFLAKGGIVYAQKGTMVNYQPQGTDTVPAMLTPGEFVVNAKATQDNLGLLHAINSGYMARGGIVYAENGQQVSDRDRFFTQLEAQKPVIKTTDTRTGRTIGRNRDGTIISDSLNPYNKDIGSAADPLKAFGVGALKGAGPTAAGIVAASNTFSVLSPLIPATGPFAGVTALGVGALSLGAGVGAGMLTSMSQENYLDDLAPKTNAEMKRLVEENPAAATMGSAVPGVGAGLTQQGLRSFAGTMAQRLGSGASSAGIVAGIEYGTTGAVDPTNLGVNFGVGFAQPNATPKTRLGDSFIGPNGLTQEQIRYAQKQLNRPISENITPFTGMRGFGGRYFDEAADVLSGYDLTIDELVAKMRQNLAESIHYSGADPKVFDSLTTSLTKPDPGASGDYLQGLSRISPGLSPEEMISVYSHEAGHHYLTTMDPDGRLVEAWMSLNRDRVVDFVSRRTLSQYDQTTTPRNKLGYGINDMLGGDYYKRNTIERMIAEGGENEFASLIDDALSNRGIVIEPWEILQSLRSESANYLKGRASGRFGDAGLAFGKADQSTTWFNNDIIAEVGVRKPETKTIHDTVLDIITQHQKDKGFIATDYNRYAEVSGRQEFLTSLFQDLGGSDPEARSLASDLIRFVNTKGGEGIQLTPPPLPPPAPIRTSAQTVGPLGYHKGGIIYASKGTLVHYQPRGTDTVPAMLTPGEFVVNRKATQQNLSLLHSINSGHYNQGGRVEYLADGTSLTQKQREELIKQRHKDNLQAYQDEMTRRREAHRAQQKSRSDLHKNQQTNRAAAPQAQQRPLVHQAMPLPLPQQVNQAAQAAFNPQFFGNVNQQFTIMGTLLTGLNQELVRFGGILQGFQQPVGRAQPAANNGNGVNNGIAGFVQKFDDFIQKLSKINIPAKINLQMAPTRISVDITGAQFLQSLQPAIQGVIIGNISAAMNTWVENNFDGIAPPDFGNG